MSTIEQVIEKVRKLRALSNSANVNEAAVAAATADRLIQEYRLEEARIEAGGGDAEAATESGDPLTSWGQRRQTWLVSLVRGVCHHYDVAHLYYSSKSGTDVRMIGRPSDIALTREMFAYLRAEIDALAEKIAGMGRAAIQSFRYGAVVGVLEALHETKKKAVTEAAQSTAIVLANRFEQSKAALERFHPDTKTVRSRSNGPSDYDSFRAGRAAGRNVDVSGAGRKRLAGGAA